MATDYLQPFSSVRGPRHAKVLGVGEAWGREEDMLGVPFIGQAGQELTRMLQDAGFPPNEILYTNVLNYRPPDNKFDSLLVPKAKVGASYKLPPMGSGKYLPWEFLPHLARLWIEIEQLNPNLILAFGAKAAWALTGSSKIGAIRGAITQTTDSYRKLVFGQCGAAFVTRSGPWKVLPTYHPAGVLRNWPFRPLVLGDLQKANRERLFPELRRPRREILVSPTLQEVRTWVSETLLRSPPWLALDVETKARQITMLGFGRSRSEAMVVPFWGQHQGSYWPTAEEEVGARKECLRLLRSPIPKVMQNGLYDLQYLWLEGLRPENCDGDTMLLHHSLYPELPKGLGFLGAAYTNEVAWKLMRHEETTKRDE